MNKILFLVAFLFCGTLANAQINKGNIMVGGNVANISVDFDSHTSIQLTPKAAWFIQDGLAVGGYAQLGYNHTKGADGSTYTYGVGPLARYFFGIDEIPAFKKMKFFAEANAGFQGINNTISNSNTNGLGFGIGPGVSYFITPSIGLEALLKYEGITGFGSTTYTNGLTLGIGFQIYLPSKKTIDKVTKDFR